MRTVTTASDFSSRGVRRIVRRVVRIHHRIRHRDDRRDVRDVHDGDRVILERTPWRDMECVFRPKTIEFDNRYYNNNQHLGKR